MCVCVCVFCPFLNIEQILSPLLPKMCKDERMYLEKYVKID